MATLPARLLTLLFLAAVVASPVFAGKGPEKKEGEKKQKEAEIKSLEEQIHNLREQEKIALKQINERFDHTIRSLEPKEVHRQLEELLVLMRDVKEELGHADNLNFGGNRARARVSTEQAEKQLEKALKHDTPEERATTGRDIMAVYEDIRKGLVFSEEHPLAGGGPDELQRRAFANKKLVDALPIIEQAHHLLVAVDHEIKNYKEERHRLNEAREQEKKQVKEQTHARIKELEEQIHELKK